MKQIWESILKITLGNLLCSKKTTTNSYRKTENYYNGPVYYIDLTKKIFKKNKIPTPKVEGLTSKF